MDSSVLNSFMRLTSVHVDSFDRLLRLARLWPTSVSTAPSRFGTSSDRSLSMSPSVSFGKRFPVVFSLGSLCWHVSCDSRSWKRTVDVWIARRREAVVDHTPQSMGPSSLEREERGVNSTPMDEGDLSATPSTTIRLSEVFVLLALLRYTEMTVDCWSNTVLLLKR